MTRPSAISHLRALLRRPHSTKPPAKPTSIPGPGWGWAQPLTAPFRAYGRMQARSPYTTQLSSSLVIYFLGDLSAQLVSNSLSDDEGREHTYAPERGLRAMAIGGISSIPSYHWFLFLGRHFNYSSHWLSIAVKIVVNQSVFTPVFNTYFFGMQSLLSGQGWAETKRRIGATVPTSVMMSWRFWPVVTALNFTFVPPQHRSSAAGCFAIFWQTYLCWLNGVAARGRVEGKGAELVEEVRERVAKV